MGLGQEKRSESCSSKDAVRDQGSMQERYSSRASALVGQKSLQPENWVSTRLTSHGPVFTKPALRKPASMGRHKRSKDEFHEGQSV